MYIYRGCGVNNTIGPEGLLPVHVASREGQLQVLRFLQSSGACLQGVDSKGSNSLHYAAHAGQIRSVRWLLRHGVLPVLNIYLESPSHIASQFHHAEIVSLLSKFYSNNEQTTRALLDDSKLLDSGNSSLSSSNPSTSITTNCHCTESPSHSSTEETSNTYTVRSVQSFFLHPPKSSSSSGSTAGSNPSSFYLHKPLKGSVQEETNNNIFSPKYQTIDTESTCSNPESKNSVPSFRLHDSPSPNPKSSEATTPTENVSPFHLHSSEDSSVSIQQSLDYSIETTMAPVNNQFLLSSPVVVQADSNGDR
ncbi:unnamed protein product, partial [Allacma fusca]